MRARKPGFSPIAKGVMQMRVIPVDGQNDPVMNGERQRVQAWAATHNWRYFAFSNWLDILGQLSQIVPPSPPLETLEIDAHGNPTVCDDIQPGNVVNFGKGLRGISGFSGQTRIFPRATRV